MTVYVDDMRARFGQMIMCHMIADTDEELHAMAEAIGVARKWHQRPPKHSSHYDIALSKRALAIAAGAVPITMRQAAAMCRRRKETGELGSPVDALEWRNQRTGPLLQQVQAVVDDIVSRCSPRDALPTYRRLK
ncbi:DUF4031 domain-containing protein [Caballeronia sp. LZ032]|uniref:DUF4031 domain-containing protein n=1 Tax=Caballeronia sp. LZ032 TaxID=3038565 RepID=UPI00285A6F5B|nr:DUF4031 domain-containing protein [Caballeronia sp. LZ032]MDR5883591.1 DUF4031 domain-containing protein [Caballeronia sp. LZ032]